MRNAPKKERRIFLDSSVVFAAVLSPTGGSFRVIREARMRGFSLCITRYVIQEVERGLTERYPRMVEYFHSFFIHFPFVIVRDPMPRMTQKYMHYLPAEDTPILAAAISAKAKHLLTLDKQHFLIPLRNIPLPIKISTPGEFIQTYFI